MIFNPSFASPPRPPCARTAENFRQMCTGEAGVCPRTGRNLTFKTSRVHTVKKSQWLIGGDITNNTSQGGTSIFENNRTGQNGRYIADENFRLSHGGQGIVGMCNFGPHSAMSQFYITQGAMPHLDGNHVVVGRVIEGSDTLKIIDKCAGLCLVEPTKVIKVIACGELYDY